MILATSEIWSSVPPYVVQSLYRCLLLNSLHDIPSPWLIRLKRIYNFWCFMLVFTPFAYCFVTLSWHFYAFSGTNILTSRHSASFLFSAIFVFQKWYTGNILGIGRNKFLKSYFVRELPEIRIGVGGGAIGAPHTRPARPGPGLRQPGVRPPGSTSDIAPSPIKTPWREKPKYPINFPEHIAIHCRRRPKDWEGPKALPDTLPKRGIATGGLLHRHACLRSDEWVVYLGLWVHSSS
jgi:hypothetical protein